MRQQDRENNTARHSGNNVLFTSSSKRNLRSERKIDKGTETKEQDTLLWAAEERKRHHYSICVMWRETDSRTEERLEETETNFKKWY